VEFLDIGMIGGLGQDTGDDPPLVGHLQAFFKAKPFDTGRHRFASAPWIVGLMIAATCNPRL
jgi:hypothetical protein